MTYLDFVASRCRPNTCRDGYDLRVFFTVVGLAPQEVTPREVMAFMTAQRRVCPRSVASTPRVGVGGRSTVEGVEPHPSRRRLSVCRGSMATIVARGDLAKNPVPRGLPTRRERSRPIRSPLVRPHDATAIRRALGRSGLSSPVHPAHRRVGSGRSAAPTPRALGLRRAHGRHSAASDVTTRRVARRSSPQLNLASPREPSSVRQRGCRSGPGAADVSSSRHR